MICIPIVATTEEDALLGLKRAEKVADVIELRLDLLPRKAWPLLLKQKRKPCIVTLRSERQGGRFKGEEAERIQLLEETLVFQPSFIDAEWDTPPKLIERLKKRKGKETSLILSYHDFHGTPDDLEGIWKKVNLGGGDLVKIATYANGMEDNVKILKLAQNHAGKIIAFCMGPIGLATRILTLLFGGFITYGCIEEGKASAPGQISAQDLIEIYQVRKIDRRTQIFGIVGDPLSHSLSPVIHNGGFQRLGLNAVYIPFEVPDLKGLLPAFQFLGVQGFSVTLPHKERILPLLDEVDEKARAIGAVNTVWRRGERWIGGNTDADGAWKALEGVGVDLKDRPWMILGAGGAARAVAYSAGTYGRPRSITFLGQSQKRLEEMVREMGRHFSFPLYADCLAEGDLKRWVDHDDIIVNCTPIGMFPKSGEIPISPEFLSSSQLIFDTVYNPLETRLLKEGRNRGCKTVSGLEMFLFQGAAQFEIWTGENAPLNLMRQKALERLGI
jgi:3-dehydroquinate dehydratase/shikimate dehydrogenase